jgi:hypothetical protein
MSSPQIAPLPFPGRIIKAGDQEEATVRAVQTRLNEVGCGPIDVDGDFRRETIGAVKLFQARFTDADGVPLKVDGEVGSLTWAALFGVQSVVSVTDAPSRLLRRALEIAVSEIGIMEEPPGSNRGSQVDRYVESVGLNPSGKFAWCAAFTYFCYDRAARELDRSNPVVKTAGVMAHWSKAGTRGVPRITKEQAVNNPALVHPGHIFIISIGSKGLGHTGIVERVDGGKLVTIEGNTNDGGSREGVGVFRRSARKIADINKGYIDYSQL